MPYPRTPSGNRFILVVTDLFSRWVEGFAISTSTTSEIVRLLEEEVFTRQGYPGAIITDNGSQFTFRHWTRACRHWQTRTWTTALGEPYGAPQPGAKEGSPLPLSWTGTEHVGQRTLHGSVQCAPPAAVTTPLRACPLASCFMAETSPILEHGMPPETTNR
jgi:hypothetical protein